MNNATTVEIYCFCNPTSGGGKAKQILEGCKANETVLKSVKFSEKQTGSITCYDLKNDASRAAGFESLKQKEPGNDKNEEVLIIVAGGDGTIKWVISELVKIGRLSFPLGVIPFGTGNDLSRACGWGWTAPSGLTSLKTIVQVFKDLCEFGQPIKFDVWNVNIEAKSVEWAAKSKQPAAALLSAGSSSPAKFTEQMINYFSIGQDAKAVYEFEKHRRKSQFGNTVQFAIEGGKLSLGRRTYLPLDSIVVGGASFPLLRKAEGLIVQNIPSYAAGLDIWNNSTGRSSSSNATQQQQQQQQEWRQHVGDGKLEVNHLRKVLDLGLMKGFGISATSKLASGKEVIFDFANKNKVDSSSTTTIQFAHVDGEPFKITDPVRIVFVREFGVTVLRKNQCKKKIADLFDVILKQDYLLKYSGRLFHERFVVLGEIGGKRYFAWYDETRQRGMIRVDEDLVRKNCRILDEKSNDNSGMCFTLNFNDKKKTFMTLSKLECSDWVNRIIS